MVQSRAECALEVLNAMFDPLHPALEDEVMPRPSNSIATMALVMNVWQTDKTALLGSR